MSGPDAPEPNGNDQEELSPMLADLLEQVCCGDVAIDDLSVAKARRGSVLFAAELDAMLATMQTVDDAAAMEREVLGASHGQPLVDAGSQVDAGGQFAPRAAGIRRSWPALAAILVAVLGAALWQFGAFDKTEPRGLQFLSGAIRIAAEQDGVLAFDFALPEAGWYSVEVLEEATGELLQPVEEVAVNRWRATDAARASWPEVVKITVCAHDRFGNVAATGRVRLRR